MMVCIGRLPGAMALGVSGIGDKRRAPIMEQDTRVVAYDAGAKHAEQRIDKANCIAIGVNHGEIHRIG